MIISFQSIELTTTIFLIFENYVFLTSKVQRDEWHEFRHGSFSGANNAEGIGRSVRGYNTHSDYLFMVITSSVLHRCSVGNRATLGHA